MSRPTFHHIFLRLPSSAAVVLLTSILGSAQAGALPRQTTNVGYQDLDVVSWPLLPTPTPAPWLPVELLRRQNFNTICGYIAGDSALPATCSAGSHCVLDQGHGVIGCCPDNGPCTAGVYTGCVDVNSPPQTELNPYIYTCQGSNVCFKNEFAGGFNQYGCGTASDLGTTVQTSIQGATTALDLPAFSVPLTQEASSLSEPTTIGSASSRSSSSSQTSSSTTSASTSQSTTSSTTPTASQSTTQSTEAPTAVLGDNRNAVIIGATLGSVFGVVFIAIAAFCLMKNRRNHREGPGRTNPTAPDMSYDSRTGNHGAAFAPLPSWQDDDSSHSGYDYPRLSNESQLPMVPPPLQHHPAFHQQPILGVGTGLTPVAEERHEDSDEHEGSHKREINASSRTYADDRLGEVSEEEDAERLPLAAAASSNPLGSPGDRSRIGSESDTSQTEPTAIPSPSRRSYNRPLWQQNRSQSRNVMWM